MVEETKKGYYVTEEKTFERVGAASFVCHVHTAGRVV